MHIRRHRNVWNNHTATGARTSDGNRFATRTRCTSSSRSPIPMISNPPDAVIAAISTACNACATPDAASDKADRLNRAAIESGRHVCGRELITLSVGMAFCPDDGTDVERLLAEADRRMYSMKQIHHAEAAAREQEIKTRGAGAQ